MAALDYSFSQIEAFACIAEQGSLSKAALFLGKDRTTLRDLLDYLEDALGYRLFIREGRKLILTPQGQQLHRQAHLLLRQARAFESYAHSLRVPQQQELVMVYDPFIPAGLTAAITTLMSEQGIRFSAWSGSRLQAEAALSEGSAHLALCQSGDRALGTQMEWCALGSVELDFYASRRLLQDRQQPLTLLDLSVVPQLVMHRSQEEQTARRLQISGQTLYAGSPEVHHRYEERKASAAARYPAPPAPGSPEYGSRRDNPYQTPSPLQTAGSAPYPGQNP